MDARILTIQLEDLKRMYVDCGSCPPERNCCVFEGDYSVSLPVATAFEAIGENLVREMKKRGQVVEDKGRYEIRDTACPMLGARGCSIYDHRESFAFESCIRFPMSYHLRYYSEFLQKRFDGAAVVDYRCSSIEKNFNLLAPILAKMNGNENGVVLVRGYTDKGIFDELLLEDFLKKVGNAPRQKMFLKKEA